jgi:hypothetical protein
MLPTKFRLIWPNGFREESKKSANQKQELPVAAMFVNGLGWNERGPLTNMAVTDDSCFWLADFLDSSPLKPFGQMNRNLLGSIWAFFIEDLPRKLPTKFRFIWPSGFRGEDFLEINQSETRMACGGHFCYRIGTKWALFIEDRRLLTFHILIFSSKMKWNLVGSIYGRSSPKIAHFVPIHQQTWPP